MKKLLLMIVLFVFAGVTTLFAQTRVITGTITSAVEGEGPIPGVTVQVKGTTIGASTDVNGNFSITVPVNATTLVFSYIGMKSQEVAIGNRTVINAVLESDLVGLDEVVVTALGISRERKALGYAIQDVKSDELTKSAQSNVISSLNGKIAGLQVSQAGGQIGASSRIVIRGNSSLGDNQPLVVIDGIPISNSSQRQNNVDFGSGLYDINPDDIESISVLKGGSAALYGMRAGHGVILITTKSGSRSRSGLTVTYDGNFNVDQVYSLQKMQNKYGQGYLGDETFYKLAQEDGFEGTYQQFAQGDYDPGFGFSYFDGLGNGVNDGVDESWGPRLDSGLNLTQYNSPRDAGGNLIATPWVSNPNNIKDLYQLGYTTNHNISITANSERATTRASLGYRTQSGVLPNTDLTRYSLNFNTTIKLGKMWDYDVSANYTRSESDNLPMTEYNASNPMQSMGQWFGRQVDMKDLKAKWTETMENGYPYNWNSNYHNNPYWSLNKNTNSMDKDRLFGKTSLYFSPVSSLKFEGRLGIDYYNSKTFPVVTYRSNEVQAGAGAWDGGYFDLYDIKNYEVNADFIATYAKTFGDFNFDVLAGANYRDLKYESSAIGANQLTVPDLFTIANAKGSPVTAMDHSWIRSNSVYGSATVGYKGMIYVDGSVRNDWTSTIADPFFYPAVSVSWIPTETFGIESPVLSFLKLRGGIAKIGSATSAYRTDPYFSASASTIFGVTQYSQSTEFPPTGLRPEQVVTTELGLETRLFNNRIAFDVSLYDKTTTDQILPVAISKATGYNTMLINAGEINNKGIEVQFRANAFSSTDGFNWDITVNWSKDQSKIIDLYTDPVTNQPLASYNIGSQWSTYVQARPDEPWGVIVGRGMVRRESDNAIIVNSAGFPRTATNMILGNVNPDWLAGIRNDFSYKAISLGFMIDVRKGGDIFSVSQMFGAYSGLLEFTAKDEIRRDGLVLGKDFLEDEKVVKVVAAAEDLQDSEFAENDLVIGAQDFFESYYSNRELSVYDGSYVKLREAYLSYRLPQTMFGGNIIKSGTVSLVGSNLAILWRHKSNISGLDPETSVNSGNSGVGLESTSYPPSRSMGVKLSFTF
ncbi:MAG: SusC/RagA family TonB-linked outer membrane protein [Bacteroidales bacterium]|nr:SusC/RagA family TonB-linked outer membrane protein [Bacteroidales bacterium]